jgi:hypothetical protein
MGETPRPPESSSGTSSSFVLGHDQVPAVEAVLAPVDHDVAGLPGALGRRVRDQVRPPAAIDARDHRIHLHLDAP